MSKDALSPGKHILKVEFIPESPAAGAPATVKLYVDDKLADEIKIKRQVAQRCGTETLDVGMDCVSSVCDDYHHHGLFEFNGVIESVTLEFPDGDNTTGMDRLEMATKMD
jgi:hypothetical protein